MQRYVQFRFFSKRSGASFFTTFLHDVSRKIFLMLYSINWTIFIFWLPFLFEILDNICFAVVCFPGCGVTDFEINHIILTKPFFYMTKKSRQKFQYLENEKRFQDEKKHFSSIVKGFHQDKKNCELWKYKLEKKSTFFLRMRNVVSDIWKLKKHRLRTAMFSCSENSCP